MTRDEGHGMSGIRMMSVKMMYDRLETCLTLRKRHHLLHPLRKTLGFCKKCKRSMLPPLAPLASKLGVLSEKEICGARKNAEPLEPLAKYAGNNKSFEEDQAEPLEPLAKCARVFAVLRCLEVGPKCAPGKKSTVADSFGFTQSPL